MVKPSWYNAFVIAICLLWLLCVSKEDVEKCKQKDLLEQTMLEMIGEFPALHQTIVAERDIYLTHTLRQAARCVEAPPNAQSEHRSICLFHFSPEEVHRQVSPLVCSHCSWEKYYHIIGCSLHKIAIKPMKRLTIWHSFPSAV